MKTVFTYWILATIIISGLSALAYMLAQQTLRLSANDPQIQMAEDLASKLASGVTPQDAIPHEQVDIANSLATFIVVFDNTGTPLAGSAQLNGQIPTLPVGIFDYVREHGEDRISWEPQPGVRSAVVVTKFAGSSSGFVLVGRSLREVEKHIQTVGNLTIFGWLSTLLVSFLVSFLLLRQSRPHSSTKQPRL